MSKEKTAFIPKQYFAVVAVLLAIMMSVLDGTIMNIALPTLAHDFDVTPSNPKGMLITKSQCQLPNAKILPAMDGPAAAETATTMAFTPIPRPSICGG